MFRRFKMLLLWQGSHADSICEKLQSDFANHWNHTNGESHGELEFRVMKPKPGDWLHEVTSLIIDSDVAIAIQGPESRSASDAAGNLWLEVGIWLGHRDQNDLFIASLQPTFLIDGEEEDSPQKVRPPSNLPQQRAFTFKRYEELTPMLSDWLVQRIAARQAARSAYDVETALDRVKATFGEQFASWLDHHATRCASGPWQPSVHLLTFVAELLRMGRANRELADFSAHLGRVGVAARDTATLAGPFMSATTEETKREVLSTLNDLVGQLHRSLKRLGLTVERLLRKRHRSSNDQWPAMLENFLRFRSDRSEKIERLQDTAVPSARELKRFALRAADFLAETASEDEPPPLPLVRSLNTGNRRFGDIKEFADDALLLARYCEDFRIAFYGRTSEAMQQHFNGFSSKGAVANSLESIVVPITSLAELSRWLPHNDPDNASTGWPVPIWPGGRNSGLDRGSQMGQKSRSGVEAE